MFIHLMQCLKSAMQYLLSNLALLLFFSFVLSRDLTHRLAIPMYAQVSRMRTATTSGAHPFACSLCWTSCSRAAQAAVLTGTLLRAWPATLHARQRRAACFRLASVSGSSRAAAEQVNPVPDSYGARCQQALDRNKKASQTVALHLGGD